MTTQTEITPATKEQLDALIEIVKDAGMNEAAGLLQLGSDEITKELKARAAAEIREDYQERNDLYAMGMGY